MSVCSLFPASAGTRPLEGLYLELNLQQRAAAGELLIYANYINSLDGRIALTDSSSDETQVPEDIVNPRDWRLYQELAAQSDVMIVSARYFRQLARGKAQDILPVGNESAYADILEWRKREGLKPQPDLLIISRTLDIPIGSLQRFQDRRIMVCTGSGADQLKSKELQDAGVALFVVDHEVTGVSVKELLIKEGYRSAYMISGPEVFRMLMMERVVDYLFLTTRLRLIGGDCFDTILNGDVGGYVDMQLTSLYLDQHDETAQLFASYQLQRE